MLFTLVLGHQEGGDQIYKMRWLFVAVGLNALFRVLPHCQIKGLHATQPSHIILTPGRPVIFGVSYFMLSAIQLSRNHSYFKVFGMTLFPLLVTFYDYSS